MSLDPVSYENVTLRTVDQAVQAWFDKTVDAHVERPDGARFKVTAQLSSGERAVTSRERRGIRDANGVLILPIISIRRSGVDPTPTMSALGVETPFIQIAKRLEKKTSDLANLNLTRDPAFRKPLKPVVYQVTTIPFPNRSVLTYELQIQAQFITQMNAILEKMFNELDLHTSFVAPFHNDGKHPQIGEDFEKRQKIDRGYVVGFMDAQTADNGNFEEFTDQERIVRWSTQIRVPAVLQLDPEGEKPAIQTQTTSFNLRFAEENITFLDNPEDADKIFGPR